MSVWSADYADLLEGNPDLLDPEAVAMLDAANAIESATEALRGLIEDQTSQASDALAETASEVARSLSKARLRYRNTGEALLVFAADLRPIQNEARTAITHAEYYDQKVASLPYDISDREGDLLRAEAAEASPTKIQEIEDDLWRLRNAQSNAYGEVDDARRALNAARDRLRVVADKAISKIETAIEGDKDSFADNWNQFWEAAAGWIGEWAASVLKGILEFLGELLAVLVAIIVIILVIVIVIALLSLIAAVIGWVALAVIAILAVAALLLTFLVRETKDPTRLTPDGDPEKGDRVEPTRSKYPSDADDATTADEFTSEDYGDLFQEVGLQDAAGETDYTAIRVVAITDEAGNILGYRVQLPSTQNWSPFNTDGALNDLSADAMLALFPGMKTQYEKAVWDALTLSGALDNDAPIMLTGWSLGGMMAGDLAADPALAGRVQSVVTAGSAIDKHAGEIDPSVRVTQFNNRWDPVHTLEFVGYDDNDVPGENWETYHPVDLRIHDSTMYGELADDMVPEVRPGDGIFFADDVAGTHEEVYEMVYSRG